MRILSLLVFLSIAFVLGVGLCGRWNAVPQVPVAEETAPVAPVPPPTPAPAADPMNRDSQLLLEALEKMRRLEADAKILEHELQRPKPSVLPDIHDPAEADHLREQLRNGQFTPL